MPDAPDIAVIGGGPAGLMAAETAAKLGRRVTLFDAMPSVGRKFLLAGRGGLNLTHSEQSEFFLERYGMGAPRLKPVLDAFSPQHLRDWAAGLGQATHVGSSGRVFPEAMKASPLLRAWLRRLVGLGVTIETRTRWLGWSAVGALRLAAPDGTEREITPGATILALGGASWPRLGSDGAWAPILAAEGIAIAPLRPSNSGVAIAWSHLLRDRFAGEPLKRIALECGGRRLRGEVVITKAGLEGGAVYALAPAIRAAQSETGTAPLTLDLRPDETEADLAARLTRRRPGASLSTHLRKSLNLAPVAVALLREGGPPPADPLSLARLIKALPLTVTGIAAIERAISTAGGVAFDALDEHLMLRARPGVFVAGEMLDWEAPTGGYLLQACFATGVAAALGALSFLDGKARGADTLEALQKE